MTLPALSAGLYGINKGMDNLRVHANEIAQASKGDSENPDVSNNVDIARSLVGMKEDELQVKSSARVIKTVDNILGSLFDEWA